jgi:UDP-glucose 4-epimerase
MTDTDEEPQHLCARYKYILLAGGLGYIGSNVAYQILSGNDDANGDLSKIRGVVIVDNLENSLIEKYEELKNIFAINMWGCDNLIEDLVVFRKMDIGRDVDTLSQLFAKFNIEAVINLAGAKSVPESKWYPQLYYKNITIQNNLLEAMEKGGCFNLIFSSSATVYGEHQNTNKFDEKMQVDPMKTTSIYGFSKAAIEQILQSLCNVDPRWNISCLRYFNPAGCLPWGVLREQPIKECLNVFPILLNCVLPQEEQEQQSDEGFEGREEGENQKVFKILGTDHPTPDGTPERDYVHITDLANAHYVSLSHFKNGFHIYNVGTGIPVSVLELIKSFEKYSGKPIRYEEADRREGDASSYFADTSKITAEMGWKAVYTFEDIVSTFF